MARAKYSLLTIISLLFCAVTVHAATNLPFGQVTTGTISSAAQVDRYSVSVNAGDVVDFTMIATSGSLYPQIQVVDSSGNPVTGGSGNTCCGNQDLEVNQVAFSTAGTYTVLASDSYSTYTGGYDIFAERMNNPPAPTSFAFGQVLSGNIATAAQTDAYKFSANAGDMINFTAVATSGGLYPRLTLFDSSGKLISSANTCCGTNALEMNQVKISTAGTYYLFLNDSYDSFTGKYNLAMQRTNNPAGVVPLVFDEVHDGAIGTVAQSNAYSFSGTAGDTVSFKMVATSGTLYPRIQVFDASGAPVSNANSCCGNQQAQIASFQLKSTETYFVLVSDSYDSFTGNYNLSSQCFGVCLLPKPVISSISPQSKPAGSSQFTLTVTGQGFAQVNAQSVVQWNGVALPAPNPATFSTTQLTVAIPATDLVLAGKQEISVFTPSPGGGTSNLVDFNVTNPVPSITSISPSSPWVAGACPATLTVNGSGFNTQSVVQWNGTALSTSAVTAAQISATFPASLCLAGNGSVTVFNPTPGGGTSKPITVVINNPAPVLNSISPATKTAGAAAFTLTAKGSGFVSNSVVQWNGSPLTTTYGSGTQLTASVPASDIACGANNSVTVLNLTPGGGTSSPQTLTASNPVPAVTAISPTSAAAGGGAQVPLTVTGSNFVTCSVIQWNGTALATTFVSATKLTATVPASDLTTPGTASVTVLSPTPGGGTTPGMPFTIGSYPVPVLTSISPVSAMAGGAAFTLTLNGSSFTQSSTVNWNGVPIPNPITFGSSSQIKIAIPAADIAGGGFDKVTVCNPTTGGGGGCSSAAQFTVNNLVPAVTSISPTTIGVGGPAFPLTVNGSNFVAGSTAQWKAGTVTTALTSTNVTATQLTATVPANLIASTGTATVCVLNPAPPANDISTQCQTFTIINPSPTISPAAGSYGSGQMISLTAPPSMPGATVYFTINGTTPTPGQAGTNQYESPFLITSSVTIQAIAVLGSTQSAVLSAPFVIGGSPMVLALPATNVTSFGGTVRAIVNDQNLAGQAWFMCGTSSTALNTPTPVQTLTASINRQTIQAAITLQREHPAGQRQPGGGGLQRAQGFASKITYYCQAVATTPGGTGSGAILSFTTQ